MPGWTVLAFFALFTVAFAACFVWAALGREQWRLGKDLLEVQRQLLGQSWARCYAGATLQISYRLQVAGPAAHEVWSLWVKQRGRSRARRLFTGSWGPAEVRALGELVSECTGWPLELPGARINPGVHGEG